MVTLLIIGLLIVSIPLGKSHPKVAGILDLLVAALILFFEVIPRTADFFDWILMILLFLGGLFFLSGKAEEYA